MRKPPQPWHGVAWKGLASQRGQVPSALVWSRRVTRVSALPHRAQNASWFFMVLVYSRFAASFPFAPVRSAAGRRAWSARAGAPEDVGPPGARGGRFKCASGTCRGPSPARGRPRAARSRLRESREVLRPFLTDVRILSWANTSQDFEHRHSQSPPRGAPVGPAVDQVVKWLGLRTNDLVSAAPVRAEHGLPIR